MYWTSGPGASHLITGLYDARLDHKAVLGDPREGSVISETARQVLGSIMPGKKT